MSNVVNEEQAIKLEGKFDCVEYIKTTHILPTDFIGIKINLDALLDENIVKQYGITMEEIVIRTIVMINSIYDKLEEKGLNIPLYNSNDKRIINKQVFRFLRDSLSIPQEIFRIFSSNIKNDSYYVIPNTEIDAIKDALENEELLKLLGYSIIKNYPPNCENYIIIPNKLLENFNKKDNKDITRIKK